MAFVPDHDRKVSLTPLTEALAAIRSQLSPIVMQETVALSQARGRILAENLVAGVDLPLRNSSAVDGYAIRADSLSAKGAGSFRLVGRAAAGHPFTGVLSHGEAVRIFTGAPVPEGADTVVMQERCVADGDTLTILSHPLGKSNWRERGEDLRRDTVALAIGRRLRTPDLALAAALGRRELTVFRKLRIGLFSTGDELCEPGERLENGQIWDANRSLLRGLLEQTGCDVADLGILRDNPQDLEGRLSAAAQDADMLVTSGGMSVGDEDYIHAIIRRRGTLDVWRVALKPGKPVGIGDIDACPILALPGNPISAAVAFMALGRVVVERLSGASEERQHSFLASAGFAFEKKKGLRQYLLGDVAEGSDGSSMALLHARQGSAMLSTLTSCGGFIVLPEECERVKQGEPVRFVPLHH
jgi:molybdopterin molybdotransferase